MMIRIKFFSTNDIACGWNLRKMEEYLQSSHNFSDSANAAIEQYNIIKYLESGIKLTHWDDDYYSSLKEYSANFKKNCFHFFNTCIDNVTILDILENLDSSYTSDFWDLFGKCNLQKKIMANTFKLITTEHKMHLTYILQHKKIVAKYDEILCDCLHDNTHIETLLNAYTNPQLFTLPQSLNSNLFNNILVAYIKSKEPNSNFLQKIEYLRNSTNITIFPRTCFLAKTKLSELSKIFFQEHTGLEYGVKIQFRSDITDTVVEKKESTYAVLEYNSNWFLENSDFSTLLNNFIWVFNFVDFQMRINSVHKSSDMDVFELLCSPTLPNTYPTGFTFRINQMLVHGQMQNYYYHLKNHDIKLEEVITWFFSQYLPSEFNSSQIKIRMPSDGSSYFEKCSLIFSMLESILKQYSYYVENKTINYDFISYSQTPPSLKNISSQLNNKYIYPVGSTYSTITHLLFSDQSLLSYDHVNEESYNDFYERLTTKSLFKTDFDEGNLINIQYLIDENILFWDEDNCLSIVSTELLSILRDLHFNDVISTHYYRSGRFSHALTLLESKKMIVYESTLLSRSEANYFSYYLNSEEFANGLKLRNSYAHGLAHIEDNDNIHQGNYLTLLRLIILLIIKINEEFCLYALEENNDTE